ncbi:MAG TPA: acireductone synthase [Verrucomicrobiae bacterium]|nr:acireductone synthase [Verrucomicrobiae bacterium]
MIQFSGGLLLLDVEGTVSPLTFVHDVLFPFARKNVASFLAKNAESAAVLAALDQMARDDGAKAFADWCPCPAGTAAAGSWTVARVHQLTDADAKLGGLKQLQGLIWEEGYRAGTLRSVVFCDVPAALASWHAAGRRTRIYSSGSAHAQRLFFTYTERGDLTPFLSGYHDTAIGSKRHPASYAAIAADAGFPPESVLFVSDVPAELNAARGAGMQTALALRPGNAPLETVDHPAITSLAGIVLN